MKSNDYVKQETVRKKAIELATKEAKLRNLDEFDTDEMIDSATYVVDELFDSIYISGKSGKNSDKEYLSIWQHRTLNYFEDDWRRMMIDRGRIQEATKEYLNNDWMSQHEIDWLIVNQLNYAEYIATFESFTMKRHSIKNFMLLKHNYITGEKFSKHKYILKKIATFVLLWSVWFFILISINDGHYSMPVESYIFIAATFFYQVFNIHRKRMLNKKMNTIMDSLYTTYECCANLNRRGKLRWESMIKSKNNGVGWDNLVYALVEKKMQNTKD